MHLDVEVLDQADEGRVWKLELDRVADVGYTL